MIVTLTKHDLLLRHLFGECPDIQIRRDTEPEKLKADLEFVIGALSEREEAIIRLRYGLGGNYPLTLAQIAAVTPTISGRVGMSKERVRQIERKAFRKLRRWSKILGGGQVIPCVKTGKYQ